MNQMPYMPFPPNIPPQQNMMPNNYEIQELERKVDRLERQVKRLDYRVKELEKQTNSNQNNNYYNEDIYMM